jgi:cysteine desulfurase / selenocysteine lyase
MNFKKDFPIFENNPDLVYLDSTASSQKPKKVIDSITNYLSYNYSNIHRGLYDIAIKSEDLYFDSKKKVAEFLWSSDYREVIYTHNSNYALNFLAQTLRLNKVLKSWDKVLVSIVEHHSNVVPWLILKEEIGIEIEYVKVTDNFEVDFDDLKSKIDEKVKIISLTHVSNVTGQIFDLEKVSKIIEDEKIKRKNKYSVIPTSAGISSKEKLDKTTENTKDININFNELIDSWTSQEWQFSDIFFIVDASQSVPHFKVDVKKLNCDFLFFTGHKVFADSWVGVLWGKYELLDKYSPIFSWWWAINEVKETWFKPWSLPFKYEPGTPNMTWAVSLLSALEYIEEIGWYEKMKNVEEDLVKYALEEFNKRPQIKLIWSKEFKNRVWVFSFYIDYIHIIDIADEMANNDICIRAGQHCAEPFMDYLWISWSCRMSLYIYNTLEDIDKFFWVLDSLISQK